MTKNKKNEQQEQHYRHHDQCKARTTSRGGEKGEAGHVPAAATAVLSYHSISS